MKVSILSELLGDQRRTHYAFTLELDHAAFRLFGKERPRKSPHPKRVKDRAEDEGQNASAK